MLNRRNFLLSLCIFLKPKQPIARTNGLVGEVYDARIYNSALSAADIAAVKNNTYCTTDINGEELSAEEILKRCADGDLEAQKLLAIELEKPLRVNCLC